MKKREGSRAHLIFIPMVWFLLSVPAFSSLSSLSAFVFLSREPSSVKGECDSCESNIGVCWLHALSLLSLLLVLSLLLILLFINHLSHHLHPIGFLLSCRWSSLSRSSLCSRIKQMRDWCEQRTGLSITNLLQPVIQSSVPSTKRVDREFKTSQIQWFLPKDRIYLLNNEEVSKCLF